MSETVWDKQYATGQGVREWPCEELVRYVCGRPWPENPRALELGCGNGRNLWFLLEKGFSVNGVDASQTALDAAMLLLAQRWYPLESDFEWLDPTAQPWKLYNMMLPSLSLIGDAEYDLVVDVQTLQHLAWPERTMAYKEIARVLKLGARFFSMCWLRGDQAVIYPEHPELADDSSQYMEGYPQLAAAGLSLVGLNMIARTRHSNYTAFALIEAVKA